MDEERSIAARIENCKRLSKAGQQQAALDEIDLILKSHPQNGFAHFTRGTILHRLGRPYGAIVELLAAPDLDGDQASIWYNLAINYLLTDDRQRARECATKAFELGHPKARELLAELDGGGVILRTHLPDLRIRVVNVVDLMTLQPRTEHPHGLSDWDFNSIFTTDKPVIFAFHGHPRSERADCEPEETTSLQSAWISDNERSGDHTHTVLPAAMALRPKRTVGHV
jgi:tetratricopeptide (TPR) repeat protein